MWESRSLPKLFQRASSRSEEALLFAPKKLQGEIIPCKGCENELKPAPVVEKCPFGEQMSKRQDGLKKKKEIALDSWGVIR
jgi:hypothetical protein